MRPPAFVAFCGLFAATFYAAFFREVFVVTDWLAVFIAALTAAQRFLVAAMMALRPAAESFRFLFGGSGEMDCDG